MKDILALVEIERKKGQRSLQLLGHNFRHNQISKDNQLYHGIETGEFKDDLDAAFHLFEDNPSNRNYRNTKNRLKERLLNHLFFLNYSGEHNSAFEKAYYDCSKMIFQSEILFFENQFELSFELARKALPVTQEFELFDLTIKCLGVLLEKAALEGRPTAIAGLQSKLQKAHLNQQAFEKVRGIYLENLALINKSVRARKSVLRKVDRILEEIKQINLGIKSTRIQLFHYELSLKANQLSGRYRENIELCTILENKYLNRPRNLVRVDLDSNRITFTKMYCLYTTRSTEEGETYFYKTRNQFAKGSREWFAYGEYGFLLMLKATKFEKAALLFKEIRGHRAFTALDTLDKERWNIYAYYLNFFNRTKNIRTGLNQDELLATDPIYPEQKIGYNQAYYLVQLLHYFKLADYTEIESKIQSLVDLHQNYRGLASHRRSHIFVKALATIPKLDYNYADVMLRSENFIKKLDEIQGEDDLYNVIEVVDYKYLWNTIMNELRLNKYFRNYHFYSRNTL